MEINRSIFNNLYNDLKIKKTTILVGPRQVGKTYLLQKLEKKARELGKSVTFFDLEQPSELAQFNKSEEEILKLLRQAGQVIFIDEFHYLQNASKLFKALYDHGDPIKIYASGSSALEIHKHLKESLAGRKFIYHILPCNLSEISQVIHDQPFNYICTYGGLPGTIQEKQPDRKKQLLSEILQAYILKDIKSLIREENLRAFNHLLYLLAQSQGNLISIDGLSNEVGMTAKTINSYLEILSLTYVNFSVYSYSRNLGNELKKSKKFYLYDLGIRNALLKNFSSLDQRQDSGVMAETFVFHELQHYLSAETEIRFWRLKTGEEVDFLWIRNQKPYPIEVKLNWDLNKIPQGLIAYLNRYSDTKRAFVISQHSGQNIKFNKTVISYLSFETVYKIAEEISTLK